MSLALYRRYRPETFAEVVGQDHVTAPLRRLGDRFALELALAAREAKGAI